MPLIESQPDAVAKIYAQTLFDMAMAQGGQGLVEEALGQLEDLLSLARADASFGEFLSSRIVPSADREAALRRILSGQVGDLVLRFLLVLNMQGRLAALTGVVAAYDHIVQNAFGRVEVDVYTASALAPEELSGLAGRLKAVLGREPVLHPYVDGSMIGGVRLQIGDQLIDASVSTALAKIREQMSVRGLPTVRAAAEHIIRVDPSANGH